MPANIESGILAPDMPSGNEYQSPFSELGTHLPGLVTGRDYGSDKEAACEGVVLYVEQAATKSMP